MDRLRSMEVFTRVARLGSFAAAARELRLSTSSVSRHVGQLEAHLSVALLRRSTRRLALTEAGELYLEHCERLLRDLVEIEDALAQRHRELAGQVRVSVGVSFAQEQLYRWMPAFLSRHEGIQLEVVLSDRRVDLIAERIDVALRIGALDDSMMRVRPITVCRHAICASPDYLERYGRPAQPRDIGHHACVIDTNQPPHWRLQIDGHSLHIAVQGRYRVNNAHAACDAALAGLGLAYLPTFVAGQALARGELVPLLEQAETMTFPLVAMYPPQRYLSAATRALLDALQASFGGEPPWDSWRHDAQRGIATSSDTATS